MSNKIDDLFSPERLRRTWQPAETHVERSVSAEKEDKSPIEMYERLRTIVSERFSGDDAIALNLILNDLHTLLVRMFPTEGERPDPETCQKEIIPAIHEILNRIEALAEAFEIAGRSR